MTNNAIPAPVGGLRGLLDALWRSHSRNDAAVLGIVVATEGSTYQKPGALVLLDDKGLRHGAISGGCLEPALEQAALTVRESGCAAIVALDTRSDEDALFGSGIGCRGLVRVLLLPLPPHAPLARALFTALDRHDDLSLMLNIDGPEPGAGSATFATGPATRSVHWNRCGEADAAHAAATLRIDIAMPPRLLLLGTGPETAPLAAFARQLGWFVDAVEHRGRWLAYTNAATIDRLLDLAPEAAVKALAGEHHDAILAMSHNYAIDLAWLRYAAQSSANYIGLLGPLARRDALLDELDAVARARLEPRLHAPVGLDLGGHGGEAVALAIVAQLQRHFSDRRCDVARSDA